MSVTSIDANCGQVGMRSPHGWVRSMTFTWALPPRVGAATERGSASSIRPGDTRALFSPPACRALTGQGAQPIGDDVGGQELVSRRLECYRARIVAPFAMLLSRAYGESHRE